MPLSNHLAAALAAAALATTAAAQGNPALPEVPARPFGVRSGVIRYEATGAEAGSGSVTFDDFGRRRVTRGMKGRLGEVGRDEVEIIDGDVRYEYDPATRVALKSKFDSRGELTDPAAMPADLRRQLGIREAGTREVAGRRCTAWTAELLGRATTYCTWKGIPLLAEARKEGEPTSTLRATSVQVDVAVSRDAFALPAGAKVVDRDRALLPTAEEGAPSDAAPLDGEPPAEPDGEGDGPSR
jgi:hypothetical protein